MRVLTHPLEELHVDRAYVGAEYTRNLLSQGSVLISKARGISTNNGLLTRAISRSTCARTPPHARPANRYPLLSAKSLISTQASAPLARSVSFAPPQA
jgi:hypothetical protein